MPEKHFPKMTSDSTTPKTIKVGVPNKDPNAFTLFFLDNTYNKSRGMYESYQDTIVDLGRSPQCHVRYGDEYPTVSRIHASIIMEDQQYFLVHSGSNPTLLNNTPITEKTLLQNGDEIQLSHDGPRVRFNTASNAQIPMGITGRIALLTGKAVKPLKNMLTGLALFLLLMSGLVGFILSRQKQDLVENTEVITKQFETLSAQKDHINMLDEEIRNYRMQMAQMSKILDTLATTSEAYHEISSKLNLANQKINQLIREKAALAAQKSTVATASSNGSVNKDNVVNATSGTKQVEAYKNQVGKIFPTEITIDQEGGKQTLVVGKDFNRWVGNCIWDGNVILTSRQNIEPWTFYFRWQDGDETMPYLAKARGSHKNMDIKYTAVFPDGKTFSNLSIKNGFSESSTDNYLEEFGIYNCNYDKFARTDWYYFVTNSNTNRLTSEPNPTLAASETLYVVSNNVNNSLPGEPKIYTVKLTSATKDKGMYIASPLVDDNLSGSPVFRLKDNKAVFVGIVSTNSSFKSTLIIPVAEFI